MTGVNMNVLKQLLKRLFNDQQGLALVMVSAGMVALLGFAALVADIGLIVVNRQRLVNVMDAAALAGAQDLPDNPAQAVQAAREYAQKNNYDPDDLIVSVSIDNKSISVSGDKNVNMTFARVLGIDSKTVSASSSAAVAGLTSYTGVAPLTISDQQMEGIHFGDRRTLKYGNPVPGSGNFGALSLGGNGANTYSENLVNGYNKPLKVGDKVDTKPGDMKGPTQGIEERIARCHDGCTYNHFLPGCPKVIIIPVHQYDPLHGRDEVTITGFAAFFIDREGCEDDEIEGYFVKTLGEGEASPSQVNYGLSAVRLTS